MTHRLAHFIFTALVVLCTMVRIAVASETLRTFDLPAGDAATTLKLFVEQSRDQVVYPPGDVAGVATEAVKGRFTSLNALQAMLEGTPLAVLHDPVTKALAVKRVRAATDASDPSTKRPERAVREGSVFQPIENKRDSTMQPPPASRLTRVFTAIASLFAGAAALPAQPSGSGAISGRVLNPATSEYVRNAEVRIEGTDRITVTENDGSFSFRNVPPGPARLVVSHVGFQPATASLNVSEGATAKAEISLSSLYGAGPGAGTIQMEQFVVSTEREGNAKAIMEQRNSMNVTNSVSSEFFGHVTEGNIGEFLKNMPGVDVQLAAGDSGGARLHGMAPEYVGVSMDGFRLAAADAAKSGSYARSFSFDQVSINSVDRIEINYTTSADMDASSPAGTINLKTKRAFERKGRQFSWQLNFMANSEDLRLNRTYGPGYEKSYKIRPGGILEYSDVFLDNRLGIVLNISESNQYTVQRRIDHTYNSAPTAADPRPRVITGMLMIDASRFNERFTPTLTVDFRATPSLVLSLTAMYNWFDATLRTRQANFTVTNRGAVTGDGLTEFTWQNAGSLVLNQNMANKIVRTRTVTPKLEYRKDNLLVEAAFNYSVATNQYDGLVRGGPMNTPTNALGGLTLHFQRDELHDSDWRITQLGGPDFTDLTNFTNPRISDDGRFQEDEIYQSQASARLTMNWRLPTWFKFGGKATEDYRRMRNPNAALVWQYNGPGGGPTGNFGEFAFPAYPIDLGSDVRITSLSGRAPIYPDRDEIGSLYWREPHLFTNIATPANFYTAHIQNSINVKESFLAGFAMGNTRIGRFQLQGGVRWEDTELATKEFQARSAAEVRAAGFAVAAANGRATTTEGLVYQYMSLPKITRRSGYDNWFPSASAKYSFTPNLQAHFGYSSTISRPGFNNLSGVWQFNENAQTVSVPNPNLRPEYSDNFTARLAYYFEPVGSVAVTAFQNDVTDRAVTTDFTAADFGYGDDPTYSTYRFISVANRGELTRIRGATLEYSQALSFLPGPFKGMNISSSYTRVYASTILPEMVPHMWGVNLSYRHRRLALGVSAKWTDKNPQGAQAGTSTPVNPTGLITYRKARTMMDLNASYQLTPRTSIFLHVRNLLNEPDYRYQIDPAYVSFNATYGAMITAGVKGTF